MLSCCSANATRLLLVVVVAIFSCTYADRGILMTFGNGANGALGHNNYNDTQKVTV